VIPDVDETLQALVRREALNGSGVDVAFDAPTREWVARRSGPTVSLYLYDIREDLARREVQWEVVRDPDGTIGERRPPARRFRLSYMVTAWTQRPEDEHRLLSALLSCFIRHERMAPEALSGALARQAIPLFLTAGLPLGTDRSIADVWSAMGGELKPSIDLVVITPFLDTRLEKAGPPVREEPRFTFVGAADVAAAEGAASAGGAAGEAATVAASGGRGRQRDGAAAARAGGGAPPLQEETVQLGTKATPGRIVRLRGIAH